MLFSLLRFFSDCCVEIESDDDSTKEDKKTAQQLIKDKVLPLMPLLLRSFDPATVDVATGNNALHEMCNLFSLDNVYCSDYELAKLLLARGVKVHSRNRAGRTPLLERAAHCNSGGISSTDGMRLLLSHGSDLNAQDGDGNSLLHLLILCGGAAEARLADLLGGGGVAHFDFALRNKAAQTAADLAAIRLAELQLQSDLDDEEEAEDETAQREDEVRRARHIHRLMLTQAAMWAKLVRPVLLRCLEAALPVTDVATMAMGYVDGSGLPFAKAAESESDEEAEPAAAAAARS